MGLDLSGIGSVADLAKSVFDKFFPPDMTADQKAAATLALQEAVSKHEEAVVAAQQAVLVAELNQGDNYTKRARPTLVYAGLVFIFLVHVLIPLAAWVKFIITGKDFSALPMISLPDQFWYAWTGVVGIWSIGRTLEKNGSGGKVLSAITGNK